MCRPAGERRPQPWHNVAQEIARAVRDDMANLLAGGLNTVDIYTASYGAAPKVVSENRSAKRAVANLDRRILSASSRRMPWQWPATKLSISARRKSPARRKTSPTR